MKCEKCWCEMFVDAWNGYFWTCAICGHVDRRATTKEIEIEGI